MINNIRVGARSSALSLKQVEEIQSLLPEFNFEIVAIKTQGDKDKYSSLVDKEESNFFTYEIEQALIGRDIDAAIHSAKDLEKNLPEELIIAALTPSISPFECLVSRGNLSLEKLPKGSRIATSSGKRKDAILRIRSDLIVKEVRGNVDERIAQLDKGDFDALLVAHAALIRLGLEERIAQIIPKEIIEPHPLQGRIAIQIRRDRIDLYKIFRRIDFHTFSSLATARQV